MIEKNKKGNRINSGDQAALIGVLNTLYDMRLPLLSVECIAILDSKPTGAS